MTKPISISKTVPESSPMNFDFLREQGLKHIQKLAGKVWTDHNSHDPGITILEQLCYAITDLSYRINYDIKDLLATKGEETYQHLFSPSQVLTVTPVTINDIRKIVIDVPGVKNAWIEKVSQPEPEIYFNKEDKNLHIASDEDSEIVKIKGLYRVLFEKNESTTLSLELISQVKARLNDARSICEDFEEVKLLDPQYVKIHGKVEVGKIEDINQFAANVLFRIGTQISPQIKFYTLSELLEKGKRIDEAFDGPVLSHGFIDDHELKQYDRKSEIHTSDIIREIMDEAEALAANDVSISTGSSNPENWRLELDSSKTPKLDIEGTLDSLQFVKQGLLASIDKELVISLYLNQRDAILFETLPIAERDIILAQAEDRSIESYYSIQNQFPSNYGIGTLGLPDSAPDRRKAQAQQLKGYLFFFDQILASYFSQAAHVKDLLGFDADHDKTNFNQSLIGKVPGIDEILVDHERYKDLLEQASRDSERKNKFLNHLLARFSESFTDYSMLLYGLVKDTNQQPAQKLAIDKSNFLKDYPELSSQRAKAFNYTKPSWSKDNISGLEKRIARKLGIENYTRRNLGDGDSEGFHLIEHILLRPRPADLYSYNEYLIPKEIEIFQKATRKDWSKCISPDHGMQTAEEIQVRGSNGYNGIYKVDRVLKNGFEIKKAFTGPGNDAKSADDFGESTPTWVRTAIDTRFLILAHTIHGFSNGPTDGFTTCTIPGHGLENGESVEIIGTKDYDGIFPIHNQTADSFDIEVGFTENISTGRWRRKQGFTDPYSLQLTYVFPNWMKRYQSENFRRFVEKTIREETPVHLTIYIQWLEKDEMSIFDQAYQNFLNELMNY